jgi:putative transposase
MIEFKGSHFEREVILWGVRWYVAYPISYRQLEEMMQERGVEVDHSTINRWVARYVPLLEQQFRASKRPLGSSWRVDETYMKVKGAWKYLYRAVDKAGATVDFLLTASGTVKPHCGSTQGDRSPWRPQEDHDRQERRQHGGDRKLQRGT